MIAVYSSDRAWRHDVERWLREQAVTVRATSRLAELAKSLVDGRVRGIVAGPTPVDVADAARSAGAIPLVGAAAGETIASLGQRALHAMS